MDLEQFKKKAWLTGKVGVVLKISPTKVQSLSRAPLYRILDPRMQTGEQPGSMNFLILLQKILFKFYYNNISAMKII